MDIIVRGPATQVVTQITTGVGVAEAMEINREEEPRDLVDLHSLAVSRGGAVLAVEATGIRK